MLRLKLLSLSSLSEHIVLSALKCWLNSREYSSPLMETSLNVHSFLYNGITKVQCITQELNCRHKFFHIGEVAFDKIHKLGQFAVLLFVSVFYLLYLFDLLILPLLGFFFKFKYAVLQILVPALQGFHLSTSETLLSSKTPKSIKILPDAP